MENTPSFYLSAIFLGFFFQLISLWGNKLDRAIVDNVLMVWGRKTALRIYLVIAALVSIYYLAVMVMVLAYTSFSLNLLMLILLVVWTLINTWALAFKRIPAKWIEAAVNIVSVGLLVLLAAGFWAVQWVDIQLPLFITLMLLVIVVVYVVERAVAKRRLKRDSE